MKKTIFTFTFLFIVFVMNAQTWSSVYDTDDAAFYNLQFFNSSTGYVVGGLPAEPYILKTTNGGTDWINKTTDIPNDVGQIQSIAFQDENNGFVTTFGKLYKTDNGADSWTEVIPEIDYSIFGVTYAGYFGENNVYYAYGMDKLFKTTDFGDTWSVVLSESYYIFGTACLAYGNGLEFYNENQAYFVYNSDLEVYAFDGSTAYSIYEFPNSSAQACISVLSENLLFASSGTRFVKISNPGDYQITNDLTSALYIQDLDFIDENMGFGVGNNKIYKITSSGYTVSEEHDSGVQLNSVCIADNNTVYAVGNDGQILKRAGSLNGINTENSNSISIFPTVSDGKINIKTNSNNLLGSDYQIINMNGKVIETGIISNKQIQLNFSAGMYMFQILEKNINSKFIIQ